MTFSKFIIGLLLLLSLFGFADATYLTVHYFQKEIALPCIISTGCDTVTTSEYSTILGIPVAALGMLYYATIFILLLMYIEKRFRIIPRYLPLIAFTGFLFSVWFMYVQFFILEAVCSYCVLSATTSTLIFIFSYLFQRQMR